jgi:superfamily II DNA/RNA helicase|tara:strand:+ start:673 stop:1821 length:1149 start_codon:yes stop_codon:yes gene_type:complete
MEEKTLSFENLNLKKELLESIYLHGFRKPSSIQIKGISSLNTGKDCILQSQSGTGKTATYLLGVMNRLEINNKIQGIILSPTRELSEQVFKVAKILSKKSKIKLCKCIGGTNIGKNIYSLKKSNLLIGTIGRIHHLIEDKKISLDDLKFLVLDEADDILIDGLVKNIQDILIKVKKTQSQICLISATLSSNLFKASKHILNDPIKVLLKKNEIVVELISQFYLDVELEEYKFEVLLDLYNIVSTSQAIIFCNTIRKVKWLTEKLEEENFPITSIHGKMTQDERNEIVKEFRNGKTRILLTTDLLSRGIDIPQVNLVINYDIPPNKETYIHRIGRCGRFGKKGVSITMVKMEDPNDVKSLNKLKNYYNINIKELPEDIDIYLN